MGHGFTPADDTSHVSAEDLESYVQNLNRAPLPPLVSGQSVPETPQFTAGNGAQRPPAKDETGEGTVDLPTPPPAEDDDLTLLTDDLPPSGDPSVSSEQSAEGEGEAASAPPPLTSPSEPPPSDSIDLGDGRVIPRAQLEAFAQFDDLVRSNPELGKRISELLQGGVDGPLTPQGPQSSTPPALPELDPVYLDDPAIKSLYDFAQSTSDRLAQYDQRLSSLDNVVNIQVEAENNAIIERVTTSFQEKYNLNSTEIKSVSDLAGSLNILPGLLNGKDPQSGLPVNRDRSAAVERALEIAYWQHPDLREKEYSRRLDQRVADAKRKQKLAGVSGSSGSVPRSQPVPTNPQDMQRAAVRELAEMMGVQSESEQ